MKLKDINNDDLINILDNYHITYKDNIGDYDISFGCELEFENTSYELIRRNLIKLKRTLNYNWKLVSDKSLTSHKNDVRCIKNVYGGEIVSPIMYDKKEYWEDLKKICQMLKEHHAKNLGNSGSHIHFDSTIINDYKKLERLIKLWTIYEDVIYHFSMNKETHLRPVIEEYAFPMSHLFIDLIKTINYEDMYESLKYINMSGISFYNVGNIDKNTIEIRVPNGTIDEVNWQNNINFFKHILLSTLDNNKDWDLIDHYINSYAKKYYNLKNYEKENIEKAKELGDFIYNNEDDKLSFIKQYLKK